MTEMFIDTLRKRNRELRGESILDLPKEDLDWATQFYDSQKGRFDIATEHHKRMLEVACCFSYDRELCVGYAEGFPTYQYRLVGKLRALEELLRSEEFRTEVWARPVKSEGELLVGRVHVLGPLERVPASDRPTIRELVIVPNLSEPCDEATYDQITLIAHW